MRHVVKIIAATGSGVAANSGGALSGAATLIGSETDGLAIDFTDMSAIVRDTTTPANDFDGDPNDLLTYSAPSAKWIYNSSGVLVSGSTLRTDYDPVTHAARGILVESQRTNLLLQSQTFDNASWTKNGSTITANSVVAPDGTTTADLLVESSAAAEHNAGQSTASTSGTSYTFSVFAKMAGRRYLMLTHNRDGFYCYFDLQTGVVGNKGASATGTIEDVGNGWYRCTVSHVSDATLSPNYQIYLSDANGTTRTPSYLGDGTSGVYIWQAQLEAGAFASSPIVTVAAQVTRAVDTETLATTLYPHSATNGTLALAGTTALGAGPQVLAHIDDGTANERVRIERNASNEIHCIVTDGGAPQCDLNLGVVANDTAFKVALSWAANDFAASLDGAAVVTDVAGTLPTITTLRVGSGGSVYWDSHVETLLYLPRTASDAELQAFAT